MDKRTLRYLYGMYRKAYRESMSDEIVLESFQYAIQLDYGTWLYDNLVEMYSSLSWIAEYRYTMRHSRQSWDLYAYSDIRHFNEYGFMFTDKFTCCCNHTFFETCPVHNTTTFVFMDTQNPE